MAVGDVFGSSFVDATLSIGIGPAIFSSTVSSAVLTGTTLAAVGVLITTILVGSAGGVRRGSDRIGSGGLNGRRENDSFHKVREDPVMTATKSNGTSDIAPWLRDSDPAIAWQVERDLFDASAPDVDSLRSQIADHGWGRQLLDLQDPDGTWAGGLYGPKWTSTTYTLLLLMRFGLTPGHPAALQGVQRLWESMYVSLAAYFGYQDPRVDEAVGWLLDNQLADGGWNCRTVRYGDRHSSFHTSISALEALAHVARRNPNRTEVAAAIESGRQFFLRHRLFRSHRTGEVANPAFTRLSFPPRWHYDLLRGLDFFATINSQWDDRFQDAIDVVHQRRRGDGTWPAQNRHQGKIWFEMEPGRGPSRWNTLRALRVLRWSERSRPDLP